MSYCASEHQKTTRVAESGFTLVSMLLIIVVLSIVGSIALETLAPALEQAQQAQAQQEMRAISRAIAGSYTSDGSVSGPDFGYIGDVGALPASLADLQTNPGSYTTWRGPYLHESFTEGAGNALLDPWGATYSYASGATVSSTGSGVTLTYDLATSSAYLVDCGFGGTIIGANGVAPASSSSDLIAVATIPNGTGGYRNDTVSVDASGNYTFSSGIPIGVHAVTAYDTVAIDSAHTVIRVLPRSTSTSAQAGPLRMGTVSY